MNVALPVFSIHGNHDDPCGLGSHSCMDLLHESRLVNYFGKVCAFLSMEWTMEWWNLVFFTVASYETELVSFLF
jgi:hypothetical protein